MLKGGEEPISVPEAPEENKVQLLWVRCILNLVLSCEVLLFFVEELVLNWHLRQKLGIVNNLKEMALVVSVLSWSQCKELSLLVTLDDVPVIGLVQDLDCFNGWHIVRVVVPDQLAYLKVGQEGTWILAGEVDSVLW